jgi:hypothetical protein
MNNTMSQPIDRVRDALAAAGCDPRGHSAKCPAHDDQSPSLSFGVGDDGKAVVTCHAGCDTGDILAALELTWADLFPEPEHQQRQVLATYDYTDADGKPLYQKVRYLPKGFSLRRLGPFGELINNVQGVPLMPYHLDELAALKPGDRVYIAEGEKDVDRLRSLGLVATTNPTGAGNWQDWSEHFADRDVVIIPDNDRAGWDHAIDVYTAVLLAARRTVLLQLPGLPPGGGDVSDWLDAGHTVAELDALADDPPKATEPVAVDTQADTGGVTTLADLLANKDEDYDWLIPGLIERGDRFVLTGDEGQGKSTLLRQIGMAVSAGLHPFTNQDMPPLRVLLIDCENSKKQMKREFRKVITALVLTGRTDEAIKRFCVEPRTEGLVLDTIRDADGDRAWLEATVVNAQPELVILGPLYKLIEGDPTEEVPCRELAKFIDRLRGRYGFAVMLEAHTPHNVKRPYGWSGWKRWPEFGLHLDLTGAVTRWRGDREERQWPEQMDRGKRGEWPWMPGRPVGAGPTQNPRDKLYAEVKVDVINILNQAKKPLDRDEIIGRAGRGKQMVLKALLEFQDRGGVHVTDGPPGVSGKSPKLFEIDRNGYLAATP